MREPWHWPMAEPPQVRTSNPFQTEDFETPWELEDD